MKQLPKIGLGPVILTFIANTGLAPVTGDPGGNGITHPLARGNRLTGLGGVAYAVDDVSSIGSGCTFCHSGGEFKILQRPSATLHSVGLGSLYRLANVGPQKYHVAPASHRIGQGSTRSSRNSDGEHE